MMALSREEWRDLLGWMVGLGQWVHLLSESRPLRQEHFVMVPQLCDAGLELSSPVHIPRTQLPEAGKDSFLRGRVPHG